MPSMRVTGFKKAELTIWKAFSEAMAKPEEDRPEVDAWIEEFSEEKKFDRKRVKFVTTIGIYAGPRDEFNQRSGSGKAIYANGDVYEGEFYEGSKHGEGHYTFNKQGRSEIDKLLEGQMWKAKPETESNEAFVSRAASALKIGKVIVETALEYGFVPCYHGEYQRGYRSGQGLMKAKDGSVYKGEWKMGQRHGQGILYFINGDMYSGEWLEGVKNGYGTYRFAQGGEYRGEWSKGVFTEGQWLLADGTYYEGHFDKKNRPDDNDAAIIFPRHAIRMTGVYKKKCWAPLNEFIVSAEKPAEHQW